MELKINKKKSINEIKTKFSSYFHFLKIEFCSKPHVAKEGTRKKFIVNTNKLLGEISTKLVEKSIHLSNTMTVEELEGIFQNEIGLPIQVFRKSGPSWLETTSTDDWTLEKQNQYGELLSTKIGREPIVEFDNDATK